jgi:hypothetical protein
MRRRWGHTDGRIRAFGSSVLLHRDRLAHHVIVVVDATTIIVVGLSPLHLSVELLQFPLQYAHRLEVIGVASHQLHLAAELRGGGRRRRRMGGVSDEVVVVAAIFQPPNRPDVVGRHRSISSPRRIIVR